MATSPPPLVVDSACALNALLPDELTELVPTLQIGEARKLISLVHRHGALPSVTPAGIRRSVFEAVRDRFSVQHLELIDEQRSRIDPFVKYAFRTPDGQVVEAVRIPLEHPGRFNVCVSSQVGCGIGCAFCGTARLGLRRSLHAWEIIDQVRNVRDLVPTGTRVHGVLFQGMGEPLANLSNVLRAVRVFWEPSGMAIDATNITVCTSGIPSRLAELAQREPRVRIGLSIGSAITEKRRELIPTERSQPLRDSIRILAEHSRHTRNAPVWAYTLLDGVNDTDDDIDALTALAEEFIRLSEVKPRVSLIPYSPLGEGDRFRPSDEARTEAFRERIGACGIPILRRYSGGVDIAAACGQLGLRLAGAPAPPGSYAEKMGSAIRGADSS